MNVSDASLIADIPGEDDAYEALSRLAQTSRLNALLLNATAPLKPSVGYLVALARAPRGTLHLLCDPLTGLVAYPSFEQFMLAMLPIMAPLGVHVAIGDVDDLRGYVISQCANDSNLFGHLAGNFCMKKVGSAVREWTDNYISRWPLAICATFGGDEVIVAASGLNSGEFREAIIALMGRIEDAAPRPCSFSTGFLVPQQLASVEASKTYQHFISRIDQGLFEYKAARADKSGRCHLVEMGAITLQYQD